MSWLAWTYLAIATGVLAVAAALLRTPRATADELTDPYAAAYLRDGRRGAVTVALIALHLRGTVDAGPPGTARITGPMQGVSQPLQLAVYGALYRPSGVNTVAASRPVRREMDALRERMAEAGLIRRNRRWRTARVLLCAAVLTVVWELMSSPLMAWNSPFQMAVSAVPVAAAVALWTVPRRTRAARRLLERARERFPRPRTRRASPESVLMAVALHGAPALRTAAPHFTRDAHLLARRDRTESLYGVNHWNSGGGGCGLSCGGTSAGI
ncbi:TIGR04222 domain-containing membrane protein [Streptomyces sp. NPDC001070]